MKVSAFKELVAEQHGFPVETQKLLAFGKIMEGDDKPVSDFKLTENCNIVLMTIKAKPIPKLSKP